MSVGGLEQLNVFFTTLDKEREEKCPQCSSASFSLQVYLHIKQFMTSSLFTTQKGAAIKKIFELRAENRTECSLGW